VSINTKIDVVFDGPPGPESGRFVEVEDMQGHSINAGEWIDRGDGLWVLRIDCDALSSQEARIKELEGALISYGRHLASCHIERHQMTGSAREQLANCSCGLNETRQALSTEGERK
jgi:hypothetical protein